MCTDIFEFMIICKIINHFTTAATRVYAYVIACDEILSTPMMTRRTGSHVIDIAAFKPASCALEFG